MLKIGDRVRILDSDHVAFMPKMREYVGHVATVSQIRDTINFNLVEITLGPDNPVLDHFIWKDEWLEPYVDTELLEVLGVTE